jgi:ABC-2 type transport system permease protein
MLGSIARFEIRYQLRSPLFWGFALALGAMTFGAAVTDAVQLGGSIGNVHRNAPIVILTWMDLMTVVFGMFIVTAFVAISVQRDFEQGTQALFFSKPIRKIDYLGGRFSGAMVISILAFVVCTLGIALGSVMPWLDPARLGPFQLSPYLFCFFVILLPNLFFIGAVFFALACLTRSLLYTYLGVVLFFALYIFTIILLQDIENETLASLLDPFGLTSLGFATRYWTVAERNTALPELTGNFLLNRLIWIAVGIVALVVTFVVFDPAREARARRRRRKLAEAEAATPRPASAVARPLPAAARSFTTGTHVRQFLHQARLEVTSVILGVPFLAMLGFGLLNLVGGANVTNNFYGTTVWPVTHLMLSVIQSSYLFLLVIILIFYSGELVWKERTLKLGEVYDALPTPTWVPLAGKLSALVAVVLVFMAAGILTTMGYQAYRGYFHFETGLYVRGLLLEAIPFLLITVLAIFLQALANNKFLGYLLMILYLISSIVLGSLDFDHNLYKYASLPSHPYSDMNGYGHFVAPALWFALYWTFLAAALFGLSVLLRVRGTDNSLRSRLRQAVERWRGPVKWLVAAGLLGFVATGAWIFYNTNVLNKYVPGDLARDRAADYEKRYRRYKDIDMPRVTAVKVDVDIFPRERRIAARGRYHMVNKTARPIRDLHFNLDPRVKLRRFDFPAHTLLKNDREVGYSIYRLARPLAPGEAMDLDWEVGVDNPGFVNDNSDTSIVYNGTFFNNRQYFPSMGYDESRQLEDRNERRKHDLQPVLRMAKVDDLFARRNTYIANDSDWIDFETVVSTDPGQVALAPGYLQREWTANGRRYFHYKMDAPILHFYSFLSADYKVKRDRWKDVPIEVYYHTPHDFNVDRMIDGVKKSLAYCSANFSPYQHRQVRILEFPNYQTFAQSFPNTIPFSESIGFIANLRDPEAIDFPFYVTAHEVAHQWWAHQVIGGNVQGSTMLSETMAQYSALMVMEHEYGPEKMRRFLKYELDSYLRNRGGELVEELPLMLVENQQYIHYRKGSLAMYALKDYIGEGKVNRALHDYVAKVAFQRPPFTNTPELMPFFERETPPDRRALLDDLFRRITLFGNRVVDAKARRLPNGKYQVDLTLAARKVRADGQGEETQAALDDWVDVGVFGEKAARGKGGDKEETVLYLKKHRFTAPETKLRLVVDGVPVRAGIDPYNKLVDRDSNDNRKSVDVAEGKVGG